MSKVQHMTGQKTGCNWSRPVFFGFSIFQQTSQLATEKIQKLCSCNRWSGLLQLGSVRFRSFFQSSELDLRTLKGIFTTCSQRRCSEILASQQVAANYGALYTPPPIHTRLLLDSWTPTGFYQDSSKLHIGWSPYKFGIPVVLES